MYINVIVNLLEKGSEIFYNLEYLEPSHSDEPKIALVYIAGYIIRNDNQPIFIPVQLLVGR